jgi:hypothetical protein
MRSGRSLLMLLGVLIVSVGACSSSAASPSGGEAMSAEPSASAMSESSDAMMSSAPSATTSAIDAYPFVSGYVGHFTGNWTNKTFGSTGAVTWDITADESARTVDIDMTIAGPVFGGPGVKPEKIRLTHLAEGVIRGTSPAFGDIDGTITPDGTLTITLTNIPGGAIAKVAIDGNLTGGDTISINYEVTFAGGSGSATGVVALKKA